MYLWDTFGTGVVIHFLPPVLRSVLLCCFTMNSFFIATGVSANYIKLKFGFSHAWCWKELLRCWRLNIFLWKNSYLRIPLKLQGNIRAARVNVSAHERSSPPALIWWRKCQRWSFQQPVSAVAKPCLAGIYYFWAGCLQRQHKLLNVNCWVWICGEISCQRSDPLWFTRGHRQREPGRREKKVAEDKSPSYFSFSVIYGNVCWQSGAMKGIWWSQGYRMNVSHQSWIWIY